MFRPHKAISVILCPRKMTKVSQTQADEIVNVLGIGVQAVDMDGAVARMRLAVDHSHKGYVCLVGVHGIMEARRDPDLQTVFANAYLVAPDGMPTVWMGHLQGFSKMKRVFGPDLMLEVIGRKELSHYRHFFCGGHPVSHSNSATRCCAASPRLRSSARTLPLSSNDPRGGRELRLTGTATPS